MKYIQIYARVWSWVYVQTLKTEDAFSHIYLLQFYMCAERLNSLLKILIAACFFYVVITLISIT